MTIIAKYTKNLEFKFTGLRRTTIVQFKFHTYLIFIIGKIRSGHVNVVSLRAKWSSARNVWSIKNRTRSAASSSSTWFGKITAVPYTQLTILNLNSSLHSVIPPSPSTKAATSLIVVECRGGGRLGDYQKPENRSRPKRQFLTPNQENLVADGNRERSPSSFDTVIEGVFHCITNLWIKDFALYTATFRALEINRKHIW